jgi:hypothetical protein
MTRTKFFALALPGFALLSAADFALTRHLIEGASMGEANPVADWILARHGWGGLGLFKLAATLLPAAMAILIHQYRPRAGKGLLAFACAAVAVVVLYSATLAFARGGRAGADPETAAQIEEAGRLRDAQQRSEDYRAVLLDLSPRLASGEVALAYAVDELAATA